MAVTTKTAPITLLEAINEMFRAVGIASVTTLDNYNTDTDVSSALFALSNLSAQVQTQDQGWDFNTDEEFPLTPSTVDGSIAVPANAHSITVNDKSRNRYPVERARKLYDKKNQTFNWTTTNISVYPANAEALSDGNLYVDITWVFAWEDCPGPIRRLILYSAAREWAVGRVPNMETFQFSKAGLDKALQDAITYDQQSRSLSPAANPEIRRQLRR